MSQNATLARPYARAAWLAARDAGGAAAWSEALGFAARVAADPQVDSLLGDPRLSRDDAVKLLSPENASEAVQGFIRLLAENGRMKLLPEIAGLFEQLRAEAQRVVRAKVITAAPISQPELGRLVEALKRRFGREVEAEVSIDESLIGGALIDAGDVVIDGSLRGKLARLETALAQ
ncbi:F0F1 ATP synthase subunit delta [Lysobacter pythonis]|uniref:ATP synthase subunit delta n=1 Tax=Solilutibacter pythonis TaxID=2483112 RepID=A0A3M2HX36_9GAMM|nr:F0F1 ATP synthase subunit delta [Lysobacter pythonis]RMH92835.1 F0F1 ATP synthase subunit delta [Lysobacter pythonis]